MYVEASLSQCTLESPEVLLKSTIRTIKLESLGTEQ